MASNLVISRVQFHEERGKQEMRKRLLQVTGLVPAMMIALGLLIVLSTGVNAQQSPAAEVTIADFNFAPAALTVPVGTTVTWTNRDDTAHTVVSNDAGFKSKILDKNEKFSYTFAKAGAYSYFCSIHPKMTGKIVVK